MKRRYEHPLDLDAADDRYLPLCGHPLDVVWRDEIDNHHQFGLFLDRDLDQTVAAHLDQAADRGGSCEVHAALMNRDLDLIVSHQPRRRNREGTRGNRNAPQRQVGLSRPGRAADEGGPASDRDRRGM